MTSFEKYLLELGYEVYHVEMPVMKYINGYKPVSTMDNIDNRYFPAGMETNEENYLKRAFVIGLGQSDRPPHVMYPILNDIHRKQVELSNGELFKELNTSR